MNFIGQNTLTATTHVRECVGWHVCFRPWRRGDNMICPNDSYLTSMHNDLNRKGSWSYKIRAQLNTDTHMPDGYFRKITLSKWKNYNMDNNPRIHVQNPPKMPRVQHCRTRPGFHTSSQKYKQMWIVVSFSHQYKDFHQLKTYLTDESLVPAFHRTRELQNYHWIKE